MNAYSILTNSTADRQDWLIPVIYRQVNKHGSIVDGNITENPKPCTTSALPDEVLPEDLRHHATSTVPLPFGLRVNLRNGALAIHHMDCTSHETEWLVSDYSFDGGIA